MSETEDLENYAPSTPLTIESQDGGVEVQTSSENQAVNGKDFDGRGGRGVRPIIHLFAQAALIFFTCCPLCCHIIFAIISQMLWYATLTQDGNDKIWFHVLSGLQYTAGMIFFMIFQCCICLFVIFIRKLHIVVVIIIYLYGFANCGFVIYALVITIISPIRDRWPNPGEWGLLVWNWTLGLCAFTGFLTVIIYFLSRPNRKNCLI